MESDFFLAHFLMWLYVISGDVFIFIDMLMVCMLLIRIETHNKDW
jgi:hypothetical protein